MKYSDQYVTNQIQAFCLISNLLFSNGFKYSNVDNSNGNDWVYKLIVTSLITMFSKYSKDRNQIKSIKYPITVVKSFVSES